MFNDKKIKITICQVYIKSNISLDRLNVYKNKTYYTTLKGKQTTLFSEKVAALD